ncbi:MAG: hypothetical protein A2Y33_11735 [Spirochaetes bacterium GWF1_51_8]|nr:MAG: hypothetical protein A2Y33_11735 [Spirochaetes bacterium GWF1_51_8]
MKKYAVLFDRKNIPDNYPIDDFLAVTVEKLKGAECEIYLVSERKVDGLTSIKPGTAHELLDFIAENCAGGIVLLMNAYCPLLDTLSLGEMIDEHTRLVFDFTYPENLPNGVLPEILTADVARFIRETVPKNAPLPKNHIRDLFESDISSYDTNIYINPSRIIRYRVNFLPDSLNDYLITRGIMEKHGTGLGLSALEELISKNPELIRKRPTFYEIELNGEREQAFFPDGGADGEMSPSDLRKILASIRDFSHLPVVMFGLYGDPFLHSRFGDLLGVIREFPDLRFIFESRALLTNFAPARDALALPNIELIFDISASQEKTFAAQKKPRNPILPQPSLETTVSEIKALVPSERVYVQFTRTGGNEDELMKFYDIWKDYGDRIIVKKPDTFGGKMNPLRVVDLSPIERHACLHLKHDMAIRTDGTVQLCRQDFHRAHTMGNILTDGIEKCWAAMETPYHAHWKGDYNSPPLCAGCDEWWVFNF